MKVALICPSGPPQLDKTRHGLEILTQWGLDPQPGPLLQSYLDSRGPSRVLPSRGLHLPFLAGSDEERAADLQWALASDCPAVWVVRGGYGLARLLKSISGPPKRVLGFSDASALLQFGLARGWPHLSHCANVQTLGSLHPAALEATRIAVVEHKFPRLAGRWLRPPSRALEAPLWGGNLCVLASLCGTAEGAGGPRGLPGCGPPPHFLFLEDLNEAPYRIDRLLTQLEQSGAFQGLAGLVLGDFHHCGDLEPIWQQRLAGWDFPVLAEVQAGHCPENFPLRLGQRARLDEGGLSFP